MLIYDVLIINLYTNFLYKKVMKIKISTNQWPETVLLYIGWQTVHAHIVYFQKEKCEPFSNIQSYLNRLLAAGQGQLILYTLAYIFKSSRLIHVSSEIIYLRGFFKKNYKQKCVDFQNLLTSCCIQTLFISIICNNCYSLSFFTIDGYSCVDRKDLLLIKTHLFFFIPSRISETSFLCESGASVEVEGVSSASWSLGLRPWRWGALNLLHWSGGARTYKDDVIILF